MAQLLEAASEVFAESGVESASVQAIADRAGASIGSLYHFFPNKQALLLAVAERCMLKTTELNAVSTSPQMLSAPLDQVFAHVLDGQVALMRRMPAWPILEEAIAAIPEAKPLHQRMRRVLVEQVEGFVAQRMPRMPAGQRQAASRFAVAAIDGVLRLDTHMPREQFAAVIAETRRAMVRYFEGFEREFGGVGEASAAPPSHGG